MCKVSFADNSETVGHTGIARLCCSQRTARTRTDCLLLQEEAPASSGGGGCHFAIPIPLHSENANRLLRSFPWQAVCVFESEKYPPHPSRNELTPKS